MTNIPAIITIIFMIRRDNILTNIENKHNQIV